STPVTESSNRSALYGDAVADQIAHDVLLQIREAEHEIGLELEDLVDPERREASDPGLLARGVRSPRGAGDADDAVAGANQVGDLRGLGGQAHDALRELDGGLAVHGLSPRTPRAERALAGRKDIARASSADGPARPRALRRRRRRADRWPSPPAPWPGQDRRVACPRSRS